MPFDPDNTAGKQCPGPKPFDPDRGLDGFARDLFRLRFRKLKLSQRAFAQRFGLGFPTIRDLEQGVTKPTPAMRLIVAAIARDPEGMEAAAEDARLMTEGR